METADHLRGGPMTWLKPQMDAFSPRAFTFMAIPAPSFLKIIPSTSDLLIFYNYSSIKMYRNPISFIHHKTNNTMMINEPILFTSGET